MSVIQTFSAGLTRFGFDAPICKLLVDQGTAIASFCDLTNLHFPEIDMMIQHLSRWKPKVVEDDDNNPVAGPTFPYVSVRKFKALCAWTDYCILCNEVPNPADFHDRVVTHFVLNRFTELEEVTLAKKDRNEKKDPPKLASMAVRLAKMG